MDMVMIGSSGYWAFTASVADSKVRTSLADVACRPVLPRRAELFHTRQAAGDVVERRRLVEIMVAHDDRDVVGFGSSKVFSMLSRLRKYSTSTASTLPLSMA